jgi:hypothetical protein
VRYQLFWRRSSGLVFMVTQPSCHFAAAGYWVHAQLGLTSVNISQTNTLRQQEQTACLSTQVII